MKSLFSILKLADYVILLFQVPNKATSSFIFVWLPLHFLNIISVHSSSFPHTNLFYSLISSKPSSYISLWIFHSSYKPILQNYLLHNPPSFIISIPIAHANHTLLQSSELFSTLHRQLPFPV